METPHSPFGVNPGDLEKELESRRASHRAQVDILKARLGEVAARAAQLRQQRQALDSELARLEQEARMALEEFDRTDSELEVRFREVANRHQREAADRTAALEALRHERDTWVSLEQQIADGVMASVEPFLQLSAFLKQQEGSDA